MYMLLYETGINMTLINSVTAIVDSLFELIWKTGIQQLIFLAGLQTINASMYEVAKIEGATGWETFWKVTFPMISPMHLDKHYLYAYRQFYGLFQRADGVYQPEDDEYAVGSGRSDGLGILYHRYRRSVRHLFLGKQKGILRGITGEVRLQP